MKSPESGFTLIELMLTFAIVAILAAMAVVNYSAMQKRAREAATKSNMHTFQLAAEDFGVRYQAYSSTADSVASLLPMGGTSFFNPYTKVQGSGQSWVDQPTWETVLHSASTQAGIITYADSSGIRYQIAGRGSTDDLQLRLTSGT